MKLRDLAHTSDPDVILMLAFQNGDEEAFVALYRRYRDKLFNFARRLLRDTSLAEETTQDVFLKLYRMKRSYTPKSRFSTLVYRIATNHCLNILGKKEQRVLDRGQTIDTAADSGETPEQTTASRELRDKVVAALAALPKKQTAALVLSHYQGLTYQEIASVLDVSVSAVKSLLFRARENLMKTLAPEMANAHEVSHAV